MGLVGVGDYSQKQLNGEKKDMACLVYPVIIFERNLWRATWLLRKSGAVFFFFPGEILLFVDK